MARHLKTPSNLPERTGEAAGRLWGSLLPRSRSGKVRAPVTGDGPARLVAPVAGAAAGAAAGRDHAARQPEGQAGGAAPRKRGEAHDHTIPRWRDGRTDRRCDSDV